MILYYRFFVGVLFKTKVCYNTIRNYVIRKVANYEGYPKKRRKRPGKSW